MDVVLGSGAGPYHREAIWEIVIQADRSNFASGGLLAEMGVTGKGHLRFTDTHFTPPFIRA